MRKILFAMALAMALGGQAAGVEENVELVVNDSIRIRGTLLLPEGTASRAVPMVILVAGSGPTDRDGNNPQMENNSLRMTAEGLAGQGIATLRYDKRGIGASKVAGLQEEQLRFEDYVDDLKGWVARYADDPRFSSVVVLGHSEGSLVALAAASDNPQVDGLVSVAGAGRRADRLLKEQLGHQSPLLLAAAAPMIDSLQAGHRLGREIPPQWSSLFRPSVQPYLISWFGYDPAQLIARVACPVLVVQGDKDLQVSLADADSLCAARPSARQAVIRGMNHVLKQTDTLDRQAQLIKTYMDPTLPLHPEFVPLVAAFVRTVARP